MLQKEPNSELYDKSLLYPRPKGDPEGNPRGL